MYTHTQYHVCFAEGVGSGVFYTHISLFLRRTYKWRAFCRLSGILPDEASQPAKFRPESFRHFKVKENNKYIFMSLLLKTSAFIILVESKSIFRTT